MSCGDPAAHTLGGGETPTDDSPSAASPQQQGQVDTALLLCKLDWEHFCANTAHWDSLLRPPLDVLLVADVVRP